MGVAAPAFLGGDDDLDPGRGPEARRGHLRAVADSDASERENPAPCVLLVEDDPAMRLVVRVNLESEGFRVIEADAGKDAVRLATSEQPDILLLDVMLPDLGGFEIASQLPDFPIVFLSARASDLDVELGRQAGAIDYVTKPFDPIALPSRLREDLEELNRSGSPQRVWEMRFGPPPEPEG